MRLFVTGGTGFIGKPLCKALAEHDVLSLAVPLRKRGQSPFPQQAVAISRATCLRSSAGRRRSRSSNRRHVSTWHGRDCRTTRCPQA